VRSPDWGLTLFPPLLAGFAAAVAVETSAGSLLYSGTGMLPALGLIITVEVGAVGLGLWVGGEVAGGGLVEPIRRAWLFCLVAFAAGAVTSAGLTFVEGLAGTAVGQGLGLGLLGGVPAFAVGSLLGTMSRQEKGGGRPVPMVGSPAVLGASIGFLLSGGVLIPNVAPYTLFLLAVVVLSAGALIQGKVLDRWPIVTLLEYRKGSAGELRVESRVLGSPRCQTLVLLEGGRLRGAEDEGGNPLRGWEGAVLRGVREMSPQPDSVLLLGGGSFTLARSLSQGSLPRTIVVVERTQELVDLARIHFLEWDGRDEVTVKIGDPLVGFSPSQNVFPLVLLDSAALPSLGGTPVLGDSQWGFLRDRVGEEGVLIVGGLQWREGGQGGALETLVSRGRHWFQDVRLYQERPSTTDRRLLPELEMHPSALLAFSASEGANWPVEVPGYRALLRKDA
jgi:hypothetical protein